MDTVQLLVALYFIIFGIVSLVLRERLARISANSMQYSFKYLRDQSEWRRVVVGFAILAIVVGVLMVVESLA